MNILKRLSLALALLGLVTLTALVGWSGIGRVAASVLSVGHGGFALLCSWQILVAAVLGLAWRVIAPARPGLARDGAFVWARLVRDASASCLPFSQLGGLLIGARALSLHGQTWATASTSTVGDITAEFLAEIVFAAAGLVVLAAHRFDWRSTAPWMVWIALALVVGSGLLYLPQRAAPLLTALGRRLLGRGFDPAGKNFQSIEPGLARISGRVEFFAVGTAVHFLGWLAKGAGGWIAFRLLGAPIGLLDALAIEGLLHAGLSFAFMIPGYAGVQEGGYMLLGAAFGVPPEIALSTSLLRRGRDIALGIPILLVWQCVELRRLRRKFS